MSTTVVTPTRPSKTAVPRIPSRHTSSRRRRFLLKPQAPSLRPLLLLAAPLIAAFAPGCGPVPNRIFIQTFDQPAVPRRYSTDFTEAEFARTSAGNLEILLRTETPSTLDPTQTVEQILYVRTFWQPVYGTTRAEPSMLNATTRFILLTPPTGVAYEGAGFVTLKLNRAGDEITADIESGELAPTRSVGGAAQPFGPARIKGRIRATLDRMRLLRRLHDADVKLGMAK